MAAAAVDTTSSFSVLPGPGTKTTDSSVSQTDLSKRSYIRYGTSGITNPPPGEDADIQAVVEQLNTMQEGHRKNHDKCYSGTHARTHGIVKGTFVVHDNLPAHLRQTELFSQPGEYPAVCRYSTEPGDPGMDASSSHLPQGLDRIPAPRGFAMKLFGVKGEMYEPGKDYPTQDIEFNSTPALDLADAKTTREIFDIRMKYGHDEKLLHQKLEERKDTELQKGRYGVRNTHLVSTRQYSQTAYRYGDYVCKYALVPSSATQKKLFEETVRPDEHEQDVLHKWLEAFHAQHDAEYLFQVQLLENLDEQPVEYAGTPWDPEKYPFQTVATLKIPKQNSFDLARKDFWENHIRVDPWHGLKSFEPLGSSNRLRRIVYPASARFRRGKNGKEEIHVSSIDQIPN